MTKGGPTGEYRVFAGWLRTRMLTSGYTDEGGMESQSRLARQMGISQSSVSRWTRGLGIPSRANCRRLSIALGVRIEDVYEAVAGEAPSLTVPPRP